MNLVFQLLFFAAKQDRRLKFNPPFSCEQEVVYTYDYYIRQCIRNVFTHSLHLNTTIFFA